MVPSHQMEAWHCDPYPQLVPTCKDGGTTWWRSRDSRLLVVLLLPSIGLPVAVHSREEATTCRSAAGRQRCTDEHALLQPCSPGYNSQFGTAAASYYAVQPACVLVDDGQSSSPDTMQRTQSNIEVIGLRPGHCWLAPTCDIQRIQAPWCRACPVKLHLKVHQPLGLICV
jgi:hypothetical protein